MELIVRLYDSFKNDAGYIKCIILDLSIFNYYVFQYSIFIYSIFKYYIFLLRWNDVPRTSRIFSPKIAIFPQFQVYSNIIQKAKQIINLLLVNNFYPVISYTDEFKKKAMNYCIRFGHSLWSVNQLRVKRG